MFLAPGTSLPPSALAAIYIQLPDIGSEFKLLGAIGNEKQTAIFQVRDRKKSSGLDDQVGGENEMTDIDAPINGDAASCNIQIALGISVEPASNVETQLAVLKSSSAISPSSTLMVANRNTLRTSPISTKRLAQRIIKNAFNFIASFSGQTKIGGEEMLPLSAFRNWWEKFERRIENDPGFLERDSDA